MPYPGGKQGAGVYQTIINQIPPHDTYIEPFAGGAGVYFRKKLAQVSHLVEIDKEPYAALLERITVTPAVNVWHQDALDFLTTFQWRDAGAAFVYLDPPYVMSSRKTERVYRHEMTDEQHRALLLIARMIPAPVMISGYDSGLYDEMLEGWRRLEFQAMTRGGPATEVLWMNYQPPTVLHDTKYIGDGFRERERIARKRKRWAAKFGALERAEQVAIFTDLNEILRTPE